MTNLRMYFLAGQDTFQVVIPGGLDTCSLDRMAGMQ
jgi:hypothetical protein